VTLAGSNGTLSLADVGTAAHGARGYVHHIEHGRRWPTQRVAKALDADGALLAAWEAANRVERADRADIAVVQWLRAATSRYPRCRCSPGR